MLIASTFFAWLILLPQDLKNYSQSLVSSIASLSNIYFFVKLDFGYFGADSGIIPLLHTWSLGIEEQFYIFWPIILIALFKSNLSSKRSLMLTSFFLLAISMLFFLSGKIDIYPINSQRWYYFPLHRAFELLFGCCLAITLNKRKSSSINKMFLNLLSVVAFTLMVVPIFLIVVPFPSFWTIVACLGATLFIYTGSNDNFTPIINKIFCFKPFVAIGLISYSLYLWHWPIIAYANYLSITKTSSVCLVIFTASILLAIFSYFAIEKPFRHKYKLNFTKSLIGLWIAPMIIVGGFYLACKHQGFGFNQPNINQNELTYAYNFEKIDNNNCFLMRQSSSFESKQLPNASQCSIGDTNSKNLNILFVGDSHARSEAPMLTVWLKNIQQKAYIVSQKTTPFLYDFENIIEGVSVTDRNNSIKKLIQSKKYKYVILGGEWSNAIYSKYLLSIKKSVKLIVDNGAVPIIILDTPTLSPNLNNLCPLQENNLPFAFKKHSCQLSVKMSHSKSRLLII